MAKFRPGKRTMRQLDGVHPAMRAAVLKAYDYTTVDFCIIEGGGLRSPGQAASNVARGTGILASMHLPQSDGYGWAVDLIPYVDGKPTWDIKHHEAIRTAFFRACDEYGVLIQNGADWDIDGIYGEPGEHDWYHFQIPKRADRRQAAAEAMRKRVLERQEDNAG